MRNYRTIIMCVLVLSITSFLFSQTVAPDVMEDIEDIVEIEREESAGIGGISIETDEDEIVKLGEDLTIFPEDTIAGDAVVIGGNLSVHGFVEGDAVCIGGNLLISGTVLGDATVIGGNANVESTAIIEGDLVSVGGRVSREKGSTVKGEVTSISLPILRSVLPFAFKFIMPGKPRIPYRPFVSPFTKRMMGFSIYMVKIIALVVFILLILLFFQGGVDRVSDAIESHFWKAALAGFIGLILIVPLIILLAVLIIGIPLIPLFGIAVVAAMIFGYACITYTIGRIAAEKKGWKDKSPYILALIGLVVIEIVAFLGNLIILPGGIFAVVGGVLKVLGFIISYIAWLIGFGGVILTRFGVKKFGK